jgi:hypothetical protein
MLIHPVRPRFRISCSLPPSVVLELLVAELERPELPCEVRRSERHGLLEVRPLEEHRHLWSPMIGVTVDGAPEGSVLDGLVGPNPAVWTFFAMVYMGLSSGLALAVVLVLVQWTLGEHPWGLWVTLGLLIALSASYAASLIGQRLARPQTDMLRGVLEEVLETTREHAMASVEDASAWPVGRGVG